MARSWLVLYYIIMILVLYIIMGGEAPLKGGFAPLTGGEAPSRGVAPGRIFDPSMDFDGFDAFST